MRRAAGWQLVPPAPKLPEIKQNLVRNAALPPPARPRSRLTRGYTSSGQTSTGSCLLFLFLGGMGRPHPLRLPPVQLGCVGHIFPQPRSVLGILAR